MLIFLFILLRIMGCLHVLVHGGIVLCRFLIWPIFSLIEVVVFWIFVHLASIACPRVKQRYAAPKLLVVVQGFAAVSGPAGSVDVGAVDHNIPNPLLIEIYKV